MPLIKFVQVLPMGAKPRPDVYINPDHVMYVAEEGNGPDACVIHLVQDKQFTVEGSIIETALVLNGAHR